MLPLSLEKDGQALAYWSFVLVGVLGAVPLPVTSVWLGVVLERYI